MADSPVSRTGIIGLGAMGAQMARHMVDKGFAVAGCDINAEAARRGEGFGVRTVPSPSQVGQHAEVVIVMVATDEQVAQVIGGSGLLDSLARGSVVCIASSCSPE